MWGPTARLPPSGGAPYGGEERGKCCNNHGNPRSLGATDRELADIPIDGAHMVLSAMAEVLVQRRPRVSIEN